MDWFTWLSRSNLDPSLIYEYGLAFSRNELQEEDLTYFNHEFLQSMGISIAKHRLEILKLAKKDRTSTNGLSKLILAITKTKKSLRKCICNFAFHEQSVFKALPEPARYREQWRGGLTRNYKSDKDIQVEKQPPVIKIRRQAKSGPLDGRVPKNLMLNHRSLKLSGPLDGRVPENLMLNHRNLKLSGPLDGRLPENLMPENLMPNNRNLKLSGPLDEKVNDRLVFAYRSPIPKLYGNSEGRVHQRFMAGGKSPRTPEPLDGGKDRMVNDDFDDQSLWTTLFQGMKPN